MKGFDPGEQTIAQSLFIDTPQTYGENLIAEFNGISINERYGGDYNYFTDIRKRDVKAKWKPVKKLNFEKKRFKLKKPI
ncbi:MAG TPA: hypothetical protein H9748_01065 [Candidatus Mediterraneibacter norwichensis]|nr:hypothetical protein [Candidatus Mediterraneibacter norwichensis]